MIDVWCEHCQRTVLLGPRRIERLENTPDGIVLTLRCWCGAMVTEPRDPDVGCGQGAA